MTKLLMALAVATTLDNPAPNVAGTWNMGVQGGHVVQIALVLKQDGSTVTGTIAMPTPNEGQLVEVGLTGALDGAALTLSGTVEHGSERRTIEISGKVLDDGTMEGTIAVNGKDGHSMNWTAERLKERKP